MFFVVFTCLFNSDLGNLFSISHSRLIKLGKDDYAYQTMF